MSTVHRALAALAGASLGATTVLVAPAAVHANPAADPDRANGGRADAAGAAEAVQMHCNGSIRNELGNGEYELFPSYNGDPQCILSYGDQGLPVTKVQDGLQKCYGQDLGPGGVDGFYGDHTKRGVENVQRFKGLPVDGIYGPATWVNGFQFAVYDSNDNWTGRCESN